MKHWLEPKDLCSCSEDLPQMWQAVISNKMKEEGAQNHLDYFGPHDFTVFLMVAILAYKSKMRLVSTPRATRVFVEALCLELRPQLLQRLRNHYQAFTRPELGHYHEEARSSFLQCMLLVLTETLARSKPRWACACVCSMCALCRYCFQRPPSRQPRLLRDRAMHPHGTMFYTSEILLEIWL